MENGASRNNGGSVENLSEIHRENRPIQSRRRWHLHTNRDRHIPLGGIGLGITNDRVLDGSIRPGGRRRLGKTVRRRKGRSPCRCERKTGRRGEGQSRRK